MLALAGKANLTGIDVNHPEHKTSLKNYFSTNPNVDFVLVNTYRENLVSYCPDNKIIDIPNIHFGGFHPDVVYFATRSQPRLPKFFMNNPTVSAIAIWGALNKLPAQKVAKLYTEEVFHTLGYMDYFDVACQAIRTNYSQHGINVAAIDRYIASREVFMHGPMHPKFEVTLSLCFAILDMLDITPVNDAAQINSVMMDPLQHEYAWGCFPPLAASLGIQGSWMIRHQSHIFVSISNYLEQLYSFLHQFQHQYGEIQMLERDQERLKQFHKIDEVLGAYL